MYQILSEITKEGLEETLLFLDRNIDELFDDCNLSNAKVIQ